MSVDLARAQEVALEAAEAAGRAALAHFRALQQQDVSRKADRSILTVADQQAEEAMVRMLARAFPDHAILGEEGGERGGGQGAAGAGWRWILDPIDGTRAFSRGGELWGPLVALVDPAGEVVVGAAALPALGTTWTAARGEGCLRDGRRLAIAAGEGLDWGDATLSLGSLPRLLTSPHRAAVLELAASCAYAYAGCDLFGCLLVVEGVADAWIEDGVKAWDLAALKVIVEEAGGCFTDLEGQPRFDAGGALAGAPAAHAHCLARLRACGGGGG